MATGRLGFWGTTVAGVVSTLAVAVLTWLFGFWPSVWQWLVATSVALWAWLTFTVPIPLSIVLLALFVGLFAIRRSFFSQAGPQPAAGSPAPSVEEPALAVAELSIISLLARVDGQWLGVENIASGVQLTRLAAERSLERLMRLGYLLDRHNMIHGTSFRLSSAGRDYALDHGLERQ